MNDSHDGGGSYFAVSLAFSVHEAVASPAMKSRANMPAHGRRLLCLFGPASLSMESATVLATEERQLHSFDRVVPRASVCRLFLVFRMMVVFVVFVLLPTTRSEFVK